MPVLPPKAALRQFVYGHLVHLNGESPWKWVAGARTTAESHDNRTLHSEFDILTLAQSLLVARGFFFFGQLVVPSIVAQAQFGRKRLGFTFADLATLVQKFLNKRVIGGFFWNIFHADTLRRHAYACHAGTYANCSKNLGLTQKFSNGSATRTRSKSAVSTHPLTSLNLHNLRLKHPRPCPKLADVRAL